MVGYITIDLNNFDKPMHKFHWKIDEINATKQKLKNKLEFKAFNLILGKIVFSISIELKKILFVFLDYISKTINNFLAISSKYISTYTY